MLRDAASDIRYYDDTQLALLIAEFIITALSRRGGRRINLRTLQMGYEIAKSHPADWPHLLERLLPALAPENVMRALTQTNAPIEEQARQFSNLTGLSRRTFFNCRRRL